MQWHDIEIDDPPERGQVVWVAFRAKTVPEVIDVDLGYWNYDDAPETSDHVTWWCLLPDDRPTEPSAAPSYVDPLAWAELDYPAVPVRAWVDPS